MSHHIMSYRIHSCMYILLNYIIQARQTLASDAYSTNDIHCFLLLNITDVVLWFT